MRSNVSLEHGGEYLLFTRFGVRRGIFDIGWKWFRLTDCVHPAQNSIMGGDDIYYVTAPPLK